MNKKNKFLKIFLSSLILCSPLLNSNNTKAMRENNNLFDHQNMNQRETKISYDLEKSLNNYRAKFTKYSGQIILPGFFSDDKISKLSKLPTTETDFFLVLNENDYSPKKFTGKCKKVIGKDKKETYHFTFTDCPDFLKELIRTSEDRENIRKFLVNIILGQYRVSKYIQEQSESKYNIKTSDINIKLQFRDNAYKKFINELNYGKKFEFGSEENSMFELDQSQFESCNETEFEGFFGESHWDSVDFWLNRLGQQITVFVQHEDNDESWKTNALSGRFIQKPESEKLFFYTSLEGSNLSSNDYENSAELRSTIKNFLQRYLHLSADQLEVEIVTPEVLRSVPHKTDFSKLPIIYSRRFSKLDDLKYYLTSYAWKKEGGGLDSSNYTGLNGLKILWRSYVTGFSKADPRRTPNPDAPFPFYQALILDDTVIAVLRVEENKKIEGQILLEPLFIDKIIKDKYKDIINSIYQNEYNLMRGKKTEILTLDRIIEEPNANTIFITYAWDKKTRVGMPQIDAADEIFKGRTEDNNNILGRNLINQDEIKEQSLEDDSSEVKLINEGDSIGEIKNILDNPTEEKHEAVKSLEREYNNGKYVMKIRPGLKDEYGNTESYIWDFEKIDNNRKLKIAYAHGVALLINKYMEFWACGSNYYMNEEDKRIARDMLRSVLSKDKWEPVDLREIYWRNCVNKIDWDSKTILE